MIGVGALLGGIEDLGTGGDDGASMVGQEKRVENTGTETMDEGVVNERRRAVQTRKRGPDRDRP